MGTTRDGHTGIRAAACLLACALLLALTAAGASAFPATPDPLPGSTFQGGDGDQQPAGGLIDWETLAAAGQVGAGIDPNDFDSVFSGGDKELEPAQWSFETAAGGATPGKDNILGGWYATQRLPEGNFLYFGFHRASTTGNTFLGFELNQLATSWVNATGTVVPCRIAGDVLLSYEVAPNAPGGVDMIVYTWAPSAVDATTGCSAAGDFVVAAPVTAANAQGTINFAADTPSALPGGPAVMPAGSFGEGAVNITSAVGDSCTRFVQVQLHSRSSVSVEAALKDFVSPVPIDLGGCGIAVDKTGPATAHDGDAATYAFAVTNTGSKPLSEVAVTDDRCAPLSGPAGDADGDALLDVDETWRYACTRTLGAEDPAVNTVTAAGTAGGERVTATDSHSTDVLHPSLTLEKAGPASAHEGDAVQFTLTVRNTGDATLDLAVSDPRCEAGTLARVTGDAAFDPGDVWTYTCRATAAGDPFVNTATATGRDSLGGEVTGSDSVSVDVAHPGISLDKRAVAAAHEGDELTFELLVTNTGDVALVPAVDDPRCAPFTLVRVTGDASFDPGETWTYTCRATATGDTFVNAATVTGTDPLGGTVSDDDETTTDVLHPGLALQKAASVAVAHVGDEVRFTLTVTNTGDTPLDVAVSDPRCDPGTLTRVSGDAAFGPGETWTYACRHRIAAGDADPFENTATATGTDALGREVTATDGASVDVLHPGLQLEKTGPATAHDGDALEFTLAVTNTGDAPLDLTVADPRCDAGTLARVSGDGSFDPGETWTYTCRATATGDSFANTATATGSDAAGGTVSDTDTATTDVLHPGISLDKRAPAAAHEGDELTFELLVTNTGDTVLVPVVEDPRCDAGTLTLVSGDASFGPGETWTYSCRASATGDTFVNAATARGTDPLGRTVTDSDETTTDVLHPGVEIEKRVDAALAHVGDELTFELIVRNTGDAPLTISLDDPRCDPGTLRRVAGDGSLDPGEAWRYACRHRITAGDADPFVNTATVTATDAIGGTATDSDSARTDVLHPAMTLEKRASVAAARVGDEVEFELIARNTGDTPLEVTASDPRCDAGTLTRVAGDAAFDPGDEWRYTCRHRIVAGDADPFVNTAVITGTDPAGGTTEAEDSVSVPVLTPGIALDKRARIGSTGDFSAGPLVAHAGDVIEYRLAVANTGELPLDVTLDDPRCDAGTLTGPQGDADGDGRLSVGETWVYGCTHLLTAGDPDPFENTASATGTDGDDEVTAVDTVSVDRLQPGIALDKRVRDPLSGALVDGPVQARPGQTLEFDLEVRNTGDAELEVALTDERCDAGTLSGPTGDADGDARLDVPEVWVYRCRHRLVAQDVPSFVNVASVTGRDAAGGEVAGDDSAGADVVLAPQADVFIEKTGPGVVTEGGTIAYTLAAGNDGPSDATGVVVTDALPAGTTFESATPTQGSCTHAAGTVRCELGDLPAGASAQVALVVRSASAGTVANTATVSAAEEDPDAGDNSSTATVEVQAPPAPEAPPAAPADLVIDKALVAGTARVGGTLRYRISAINDGPGVAGDVTVVDTLSNAVRFVSATPSQGACSGTVVVTCRLGSLAAGERATVELTVVALRAGALRNVATGTSSGLDPTPSNNGSESKVTVAPPAARGTLSKVADGRSAAAGSTIGYTITYRGLGPGVARDVVICDRLPAGLTLVRARGGRLRAGGRVCWRRARVRPGQTVRLRLVARVDADAGSARIRNVATLEGRNSRRMVATSFVRSRPTPRRIREGGVTG